MVIGQRKGAIVLWCIVTQRKEYVLGKSRNQYGLSQEIQRGLLRA